MSLCSCLAMAQTLGTEDLNVINSKKVQAFVSYALDQQGFYRENDVSKVTACMPTTSTMVCSMW